MIERKKNEEEKNVKDPAARLLAIIKQLESDGEVDGAHKFGNAFVGVVGVSFDGSYQEFLNNFIQLCNQIKENIETLGLRSEEARQIWIQCINSIEEVFLPDNYGRLLGEVFLDYFSSANKGILISISERFQTDGVSMSKFEDVKASLETVREVYAAFEKTNKLSPEFSRLFKHYLQQLEHILGRFNDYGEDKFWDTYKIMFTTFLQVHQTLLDDDDRIEVKSSLKIMLEKIALYTSVGASAVSLGAPVIGLLN